MTDLKKKNEKGMLHLDICEKQDNDQFLKNSSETRTFFSVTFPKLPFFVDSFLRLQTGDSRYE